MKEYTAIIGGTGLTELSELVNPSQQTVHTELGDVVVTKATWCDRPVIFLPRHGHPHKVPPHKINYRANILALSQLGVGQILAVNAVGGVSQKMTPNTLCLPNQIIDYTYGREATYFDGEFRPLDHIDFSHPYDEAMRDKLYSVAKSLGIPCEMGGVYGATQGPRLETAAEVARMARDGCDLVGMTGMPEAALARELSIPYASICLVVNAAAGLTEEAISMDQIRQVLHSGMEQVCGIIKHYLQPHS